MKNPWDTAKRVFRSKDGATGRYVTSQGQVDVFDPRKSNGSDIPKWALYQEYIELSQSDPSLRGDALDNAALALFKERMAK